MILIEVFVYAGIIAASISGTLVGIKKKLDLFGVVFLAACTALGGGLIRDMILGQSVPNVFIKPQYFIVCTVISILTWLFYQRTMQFQNTLIITDAIGLGVFTAVGSYSAIDHGLKGAFLIVSMGLITGIGGGIMRDVFAREIPFVFQKEIYAIAAIIGAISILFTYGEFSKLASLYICFTITTLIRIISVRYKINFPIRNVNDKSFLM